MGPPRKNKALSNIGVALSGSGVGTDEIELGSVVGIFGVRGEVRVHLHNRDQSMLFDGPTRIHLVAQDGTRCAVSVTVRSGAGKRIIGRIKGLSDREDARELIGAVIAIPRSSLPETSESEFYVVDLQGLRLEVAGAPVATVADVHHMPQGDLLQLSLDTGTEFIPFADPGILEVDIDAGVIRISQGLADLILDEDA